MKIRYVTMTGADDNTSVDEMARLSERYPFAEWGILFSQARSGESRYPSLDWVEGLFDHKLRLSAHLCGKWVSDAMKFGRVTFLNDDMDELFDRVQFNMNEGRLHKALHPDSDLLWSALSDSMPFILGGDYSLITEWNNTKTRDIRDFFLSGVSILFDASGGRGVLAKSWPSPYVVNGTTLFCGYAGGLSPDNLEEQLFGLQSQLASQSCDGAEIWIDAESGLRTKDEFDLEKCEQFLKIAEPWTE